MAQNDFPELGSTSGSRTRLTVPLGQPGGLIGVLVARRMEVRPFTPAQIKLLKTFADQAVIAIENVRLFKELQERNRDLTEALEQQTATGEVLRVIASSPTDVQPVLNTLIANAVKLSGQQKVMSVQSMASFSGSSLIMAKLLKKSRCFRADREDVLVLVVRMLVVRLQHTAHSAREEPYRLRMLQRNVVRTVSPRGVERGRCCQYHCCEREWPSG